MENVLVIIMFFIFWCICNYISILLLKGNFMDEFTISAIKYRKTIMFDIIAFIFFIFLDINFFTWIGIIYYIIVSILEGILLIISIITNLDYFIKEKVFEAYNWLLVLSKTLNEITSIVMIIILFNLLN